MRFIIDDFDMPKAETLFAGRTEQRRLFWQQYEQANAAPMEVPVVLSYYGISGIGKTALHQQLKKELAESYPKANYLTLDFDFIKGREPYQILALMRKKLAEQHRFAFPLFEVACYVFLTQLGEEINQEEIQSLINTSPVLSLLGKSGPLTSGEELISRIFRLEEEGHPLLCACFSRRKSMLNKLNHTGPKQLAQELSIYFASDLRENLAKEAHPFVLFLDTYEKLVDETAVIGDPLQNDLWLRGELGLIARLPGVIWVISGKEKLKWPQSDGPEHWEGVLHQSQLDVLSPQETAEYLINTGITDAAVRKKIDAQTGGVPGSLKLCAEQYLQDGQLLNNCSGASLMERWARFGTEQEKNHLWMLACIGTWTEESIYAAGRQMPFAFSPTIYEKLLHLPFMLTGDGVHYTMMEQVRQMLRESCPQAIRRTCMELQEMDFSGYIQLLLQDLHDEDSLHRALDALEDRLLELHASCRFVSLYECLAPLWQFAASNCREGSAFARLQTIHSMALYQKGQFEEAEQYGIAALKQLQRGKIQADYLDLAIANMEVQYCEHSLFEKIPPLFIPLWEMLAKTVGERHRTAQNLAHTIAVAYEVLREEQKASLWKARYCMEDVAAGTDETASTEQEIDLNAMVKNALSLWERGDYQGYVDQQLAAVNAGQIQLGAANPEVLHMLEALAEKLHELELYEDAVKMQEEVVKRCTEAFGLHNGTTAQARTALYQYLSDAERGEEAFAMAQEITDDLANSFGPHSAVVLNFRYMVTCDYMVSLDQEVAGQEDLQEILQIMMNLREEMLASPEVKDTVIDQAEELISVLQGQESEEEKPEKRERTGVSLEAARAQREREQDVIADIWLQGDQQDKRVQKAVNTYAEDIDLEEVLMQVDGTVRRNGKNGLIFTKDMVYFKVMGDEGSALITNIEDIRSGQTEVELRIKGRRMAVKIITAHEKAVARIIRKFIGLD